MDLYELQESLLILQDFRLDRYPNLSEQVQANDRLN